MSTNSPSAPRLRVRTGPYAGVTFEIRAGRSVVGRDTSAVLRLGDADVSRRHAMLDRAGDRVVLTDLGSANGTFVNGQPLRGWSHELRPGDLVQLGQVELAYEVDGYARDGRPPDRGDPPRTGGVRLGRVALVAALTSFIGWLVPALVTFLTHRDIGLPAWLLAPSAAVFTGVATSLIDAGANRPAPRDETRPVTRRTGGGVPIGVAIVLVMLVVGAGGYAATVGIRYGVGWVTGNEPQVGQERLASSPAPSDASGRVRATVTSVVNTAHYTRVALTVDNQEDKPATITLYRNCGLTAAGVTLEADSFRSDWVETVPPKSTQRGLLIFGGHLPDSAKTAQLSVNMVFVFGRFGDDDTIVIRSIRLRAP